MPKEAAQLRRHAVTNAAMVDVLVRRLELIQLDTAVSIEAGGAGPAGSSRPRAAADKI